MTKVKWLTGAFSKEGKPESGFAYAGIETNTAENAIITTFRSREQNPDISPLVDLITSALPSPDDFLVNMAIMSRDRGTKVTLRVQPLNPETTQEGHLLTISAMIKRAIADDLRLNIAEKSDANRVPALTPA